MQMCKIDHIDTKHFESKVSTLWKAKPIHKFGGLRISEKETEKFWGWAPQNDQ